MALKQGPISQEDLIKGLIKSKKVMSKVEKGDFSKGNINPTDLVTEGNGVIGVENKPLSSNITNLKNNKPIIDEDKINKSKLPDSIKQAMINNPIPTISTSSGLDINLFESAKQQLQQENLLQTKNIQQPQQEPKITTRSFEDNNTSVKDLEMIIENVIRKVLDEKLTQIMTAQDTKSINENLVIKVGDHIFSGQITKTKKSK